MSMKTPSFWYRPKDSDTSWREILLTPLSFIYCLSYHLHQNSKTAYKSSLPVLCVGNMVAGGSGKTPTTVALMQLMKDAGLAKNPHFMIRGYGGAELGPLYVDLEKHSAWDVGDEAMILAKHGPTIVSGDRAKGAQLAEKSGADFILMDDGLQNPGIHKDLKLVVINGEMGFGNGKLMPAGPLRQPMNTGFDKADGFIFIGSDKREAATILPADKPVLNAKLHPANDSTALDKKPAYLAFAGLGYPEKFFRFLQEDMGLNVVKSVPFSDHYPYENADLLALERQAKALNAKLITTEKDMLRLPHIDGIEVTVLPVEMQFENEGSLIDLIKQQCA